MNVWPARRGSALHTDWRFMFGDRTVESDHTNARFARRHLDILWAWANIERFTARRKHSRSVLLIKQANVLSVVSSLHNYICLGSIWTVSLQNTSPFSWNKFPLWYFFRVWKLAWFHLGWVQVLSWPISPVRNLNCWRLYSSCSENCGCWDLSCWCCSASVWFPVASHLCQESTSSFHRLTFNKV